MVHGREAKDTMTEEEKQYNLFGNIQEIVEVDTLITQKQCMAIACAMGCSVSAKDERNALTRAFLSMDAKELVATGTYLPDDMKTVAADIFALIIGKDGKSILAESGDGYNTLLYMVNTHIFTACAWNMCKSIPSGVDDTLKKDVYAAFAFLVGQKDFTGSVNGNVQDILQGSVLMYTKHVRYVVPVFMSYVLTTLKMVGDAKDLAAASEWITKNSTEPVSMLYNKVITSLEKCNVSAWDACMKEFMLGIVGIKKASSDVYMDTAFVSEDPLYQQTTVAPIATGATAKSKLKKVHAKLLS
jgi:hypothetical protein